MPDVEVKLDIKAEYQQALNAISEMGKALEDVQNKAKVVINKTNSATANGKSGNGDKSMQDIADMKKATHELAVLLVQASAAAERARGALSRISEMEIITPQDVTVLERAAAGYDELAKMANAAAEATERFNAAGKAGLTTEEMIRMTQAAEKQLETLRAQSEALERSIASQREQLNVLIQKNAEEAKAAQLTKEKNKQEQLNIALLDRQAKAEEEATFKMQLAGKTRLELSAIYKELAQKAKEAAAAQDAEAAAKYERQMQLVNQALRKVNMSARIANIALMQQAQAAQRIGQNLKTLTDGFTGFSDALKNGELNLAGMGSAFVSLIRDFKAGLGPIGLIMLALQGLQEAWNYRAKKEQERIESMKAYAEWEKKLAEIQKTNREELEKYNNELNNEKAIDALVKKHQDLNAELEREIENIDKATKLELHRLSLSQDSDAHALAMKKDELGRQLMLGNITKDEYEETLAAWQKNYDINKLNNAKLAADARLTGASEKESLTRTAYEARTKDFDFWNKQEKKFLWDEDRLLLYNRQLADADATLKETTDNLNKLRQDGASETAITNAKNAMHEALSEKLEIQKQAKIVLLEKYGKGHGMTVEEGMLLYAKELREMTTHLAEATRLKTEAERDLNQAVSAKEKAEADAEIAATNQRVESVQIEERYESGKKTRQVERDVDKINKKNKDAYDRLEKNLDSLSFSQISDLIDNAEKEAASDNSIVSAFGKKKLDLLNTEKTSRKQNFRKLKGKYLADNEFSTNEVKKVISLLEEAVAAGENEKIELYRTLLKIGKKVKINNEDSRKISKKLNSEIGR